jgi:hypothetical protein
VTQANTALVKTASRPDFPSTDPHGNSVDSFSVNRFVRGCVKMREAARKRSQATTGLSWVGLSGTEDDHGDRFLQERLRFERPDAG